MKTLPDVTIYQFIKHLQAFPFVQRIILFGSRARGDFSETSDIDLAIDCPLAQPKDWFDVLKVIDEADTLLKIDCVRMQDVNQALRSRIEQEGKIIYECSA